MLIIATFRKNDPWAIADFFVTDEKPPVNITVLNSNLYFYCLIILMQFYLITVTNYKMVCTLFDFMNLSM